jgi:hypothetical protein
VPSARPGRPPLRRAAHHSRAVRVVRCSRDRTSRWSRAATAGSTTSRRSAMAQTVRRADLAQAHAQARAHAAVADEQRLPTRIYLGREREQCLLRARTTRPPATRIREDNRHEPWGLRASLRFWSSHGRPWSGPGMPGGRVVGPSLSRLPWDRGGHFHDAVVRLGPSVARESAIERLKDQERRLRRTSCGPPPSRVPAPRS